MQPRPRRVTSQVLFDSHVELLLDAAVSFVNELTDGERRGKPFTAPRGEELLVAAAAAIPERAQAPKPKTLPVESAEHLAQAAYVMRGVFEGMADGRVDDAATAVNQLLRETGARPQLDHVPGEPRAHPPSQRLGRLGPAGLVDDPRHDLLAVKSHDCLPVALDPRAYYLGPSRPRRRNVK